MAQRNDLANAIRTWRARVDPGDVGLATGGDRRVPGLRREELAQLAGVSVDYLIRLEQGRSQHPSAQIIAALARALRLDDGERAILYRSAGVVPPSSGSVPRETPRGVQLMLDRLADTPIAVFSAAWDLLESNALWNELFDQGAPQTGRPRNLVWQQFTAGRPTGTSNLGAVIRSDAEVIAFERELVSDLRRAHERYPDDRALAELISTLQRDSSRFARLWSQYEVALGRSVRKTMVHGLIGPITLDCDVLSVDGSDLRVVLYTAAPNTPESDALQTLRDHIRTRRL